MNKRFFSTWFKTLLVSRMPKLMHLPKLFLANRGIKVCDTVLFIKNESTITSKYQNGMIHKVQASRDGIIRNVLVKYRKDEENVDRLTTRAVAELVSLHLDDEHNLMEKLMKMVTVPYMK